MVVLGFSLYIVQQLTLERIKGLSLPNTYASQTIGHQYNIVIGILFKRDCGWTQCLLSYPTMMRDFTHKGRRWLKVYIKCVCHGMSGPCRVLAMISLWELSEPIVS
jgi:hypothetical protein